MLSPEHQTQFDAITREITQLLEDGSAQIAIDRLTVMIQSMGDLEDYRSLRGALIARRAAIRLEEDDEEGAWEDAQKAMNLGWYDAAVHAIGGWAMLHMEQPQIALQEFTRSIEMDSTRARTFLGRACSR